MPPSKQMLNPWFSMWTQPRASIQQIVDEDPTRGVIPLAMFLGICRALDRASTRSIGDDMGLSEIFLIALVAGPLGGVLWLYVSSAVIYWTGTWWGGRASPQNIRAALTWGFVPAIWGQLLWVPQLVVVGHEMFTTATPTLDDDLTRLLLFFALGLIQFVLYIWGIVAFLKCLGQVQGFSAWKALANVALPWLAIIIPMVAYFAFLAL